MAESVARPIAFVDPFAPEPEVSQLYPPAKADSYQVLLAPRRPPYCDCPRVVLLDGWVRVWHQPGCTEVLGEPLEAIL